MATINAYLRLNTVDPNVWYGTVTSATSSQLVISDGYNTGVYSGFGFAYNGNTVVGGTLTGYTQYVNGYLTGEVTNFAVPASVATYYISNNQLGPLLAYVLSGSDEIYGSAFNDSLAGYDGNDLISGGAGDDYLAGGFGNDHLHGGTGVNYIDGGPGFDRAYYDGLGGNYSYTFDQGGIAIWSAAWGVNDQLISIERIEFENGTLAFDIDGNAGQGYRIYQAAFDRTPDVAGLSFWVDHLDAGLSLYDLALNFIGSVEFKGLYGANPINEDYVDLLYDNVLNRSPDAGGYAYWTGQMDAGLSRADMLIAFSESNENQMNVIGAIDQGIWLI